MAAVLLLSGVLLISKLQIFIAFFILVLALGPITQGDFLKNLGIETRLASLLKNASDAQAANLIASYAV